MIKIDEKDRKILYELSKDCRISIPKLASRVNVSREVADYRLKKLIKNKIIMGFCIDISLNSLEFLNFVMYLELKKVSEEKEKEIVNYLVNHDFVGWFVSSTGKWSFIFDVYAKDNNHASLILDDLKEYLGEHLGEYTFIPQKDLGYFHSKFFGEEPFKKKKYFSKYTLDKIDLQLLKILSNNARILFIDLASKINLTPEALSVRIKKLKNDGVIRQFFIYPNIFLLNLQHYNIPIKLENATKSLEYKLLKYLAQHPKISACYMPIAYWDIEVTIFVKNPAELRDFIRELRNKFPNVRVFDTSLFFEEFKSNSFPKGVFDYLLKNKT
ncbi:MAG: Lrp/AsnC family transcriptional regulator [Candidatus Micrarchaeia archaeon]